MRTARSVASARLLLAAVLVLAGGRAALAADVEIGQPAPDFALPDQSGKIHRLADYRGKTVILAFFPKAMTPGCTCEMQALRDTMSQLKARNAAVFGVSADTVAGQKAFADQYQLNFPLLADPEKRMIRAYGALGANGLPSRYTFVIGPDGKIVSIDRAVNEQFERGANGLMTRHAQNLALLLTDWKAKIGQPVPNFSLPNYDGRTVTPLMPGKKAAVIVFMSKNCPVSRAYDARMRAMALEPAYKDVAFLGINSNQDETAEEVRKHAEAQKLPYPVAKDWKNVLADRFGAQATPTVWVINSKGIAVYRGAIDDSQNPSDVKAHYLQDALEAVLAEKPVTVAETRTFGCSIKRVR